MNSDPHVKSGNPASPAAKLLRKTDAQLRADVLAELEWDPAVRAHEVGVAVKDGVVTLTGHLENFAQEAEVERVVRHVSGVRALAVEMDVKLDPSHRRNDTDIAAAAQHALEWHTLVPVQTVQVEVEKGWVTLRGEVDWDYQRSAVEASIRALRGVVGVSNQIQLKPRRAPADLVERLRGALLRHAEHEAKHIEVLMDGSTVTLRGQVHSWNERTALQGAAWSAPGVLRVVNELTVSR
jgi:osmotically-inducible protein OsmY